MLFGGLFDGRQLLRAVHIGGVNQRCTEIKESYV